MTKILSTLSEAKLSFILLVTKNTRGKVFIEKVLHWTRVFFQSKSSGKIFWESKKDFVVIHSLVGKVSEKIFGKKFFWQSNIS